MTTYQNEVLNERETTHGDYAVTADIAQCLKDRVRFYGGKYCGELTLIQKESLDLICTKIARILSGNPNEPDHWKDIAGYANLVSERLK
jgi:hypothetical protein